MINETEAEVDKKQMSREYLILLVLGASKKLTMLQLEKETFLLWKFHSDIDQFIHFIGHKRGPYSREIKDSIDHPMYCIDCWCYRPPSKNDQLTGGSISLTIMGEREYENLIKEMQESPALQQLLSAVKMVGRLYNDLKPEELLLLIYDTYPEYVKNSEVYSDIDSKRITLAQDMYNRGIIDRERLLSLTGKCSS